MVLVMWTEASEIYHSALLKQYIPLVSSKTKVRIARYRRWEDQQLCLLVRLLLNRYLKRNSIAFDISEDFIYNQFGKPLLINNEIVFNFSHSNRIAACIVSTYGKVGIDVEFFDIIETKLFEDIMTTKEKQELTASPKPLLHFYNYWTQKESVIKATGEGLSISLNSFGIINHQTVIHKELFFLRRIDLHPDYICHIAANRDLSFEEIHIERIPPSSFLKT